MTVHQLCSLLKKTKSTDQNLEPKMKLLQYNIYIVTENETEKKLGISVSKPV